MLTLMLRSVRERLVEIADCDNLLQEIAELTIEKIQNSPRSPKKWLTRLSTVIT
jgi:hypothetical protein